MSKNWRLLIGIACCARLLAQGEALALRIFEITRSADGRLKVLLSAIDGKGRAIRDVGPANLAVEIDGHAAQVAGVERTSEGGNPLSIVLAMDNSGSMCAGGIEAAVNGASFFLDRMGSSDLCALLVFGKGVRRMTGFTSDRARIRRELKALDASDARTYLYQALVDAVDWASTAPTARTVVVFLTDEEEGRPRKLAACPRAFNTPPAGGGWWRSGGLSRRFRG